ncbi:TPA: DUF551 domain-containing protein [Klebsiella pneumoniae]|nr:DUF551 domain-containing protein [Klebsiella pneumoniae]
MTKSTITRERLEQLADNNTICKVSWDERIELAQIALAAMDREPVAYIFKHPAGRLFWSLTDESNKGHDDVMPVYASPQPAPVVPEERDKAVNADDHPLLWSFNEGWNACRAAMLNQAQEPATYNTAPQPAVVSDEMIDTFEAEFRSAFKVSPEVKQMLEIGYHGEKFSFSIRDAATWWKLGRAAMLAAAPQSPGSEPATVPGKWIPVSEQMPDVGVKVLCFPAKDEPIHATFNGQLWLQDVSWSGSEEPIDNVIPVTVTHWMPLPAGPQEVKP